jgi:hypothetical protein
MREPLGKVFEKQNSESVMPRVQVRKLILRLLRGVTRNVDEKELRSGMSWMSVNMRDRHRVTPALAVSMLKRRRDLLGYVDMRTDAWSLGGGAFYTMAFAMCSYGKNVVLDELSEAKVFSRCHLCLQKSLSEFKAICRFGVTDGPMPARELFQWQYFGQVAGRRD